jgi:predicted RNase H-like HicB family nuclease
MLNRNLSFKLPVVITKQGHQYVAYTPALDISTVGKSEKDVQKKFEELVTIFLEEIIEAGTVRQVLTELGWSKKEKAWNPPEVVSTDTIGINIPVFA